MRNLLRLFQVCCALAVASRSASSEESKLGGRYVLSQRTVVVSDIPILPDISTETWSVSLLDLAVTSERLYGAGSLCHIEMQTSSSLVRTELPAAFRRLLSDVRLDAQLTRDAGGFRLEETPRVRVLGAALEDPAREPLPLDAGDRRVIDEDGDGRPGVTVRIRGIVSGDVYVVQRGSSGLRGTSDPAGFHGSVRFRSEDVVLGASKPMLTRRTQARPDPSRSTFVLRRVGPEVGCAAALQVARRSH